MISSRINIFNVFQGGLPSGVYSERILSSMKTAESWGRNFILLWMLDWRLWKRHRFLTVPIHFKWVLLVHLVCPFFVLPLWENQCHGLLTRGYEVHGVPHYSACGGLFVLAAESFAVLTQGHAPTHWGEKSSFLSFLPKSKTSRTVIIFFFFRFSIFDHINQ